MAEEEEAVDVVVGAVVGVEEEVVAVAHLHQIMHQALKIPLHQDNWLDQERVYYALEHRFVAAVVHKVQCNLVVLA